MANPRTVYRALRGSGILLVLTATTLLIVSCSQQQQQATISAPTGTPAGQATTAPAPISPSLLPSPAPTAPAALPASTLTSTAQCTVSPVKALGTVYSDNPNLARALGCAQQPETDVYMAEEQFQKGFMYWRGDTRQIYAIMGTGRWAVYPDTWNEGDPSPSIGTPAPSGTTEPVRGFGKVWREQSGVRDGLGWATSAERGFNGVMQPFANGTMLWSDKRIIFVLFSDGTWLRFADAS